MPADPKVLLRLWDHWYLWGRARAWGCPDGTSAIAVPQESWSFLLTWWVAPAYRRVWEAYSLLCGPPWCSRSLHLGTWVHFNGPILCLSYTGEVCQVCHKTAIKQFTTAHLLAVPMGKPETSHRHQVGPAQGWGKGGTGQGGRAEWGRSKWIDPVGGEDKVSGNSMHHILFPFLNFTQVNVCLNTYTGQCGLVSEILLVQAWVDPLRLLWLIQGKGANVPLHWGFQRLKFFWGCSSSCDGTTA